MGSSQGNTCGPSAHLRAGRPRSQEGAPGESGYAWAHSWERGHLARLNTRMDLQHTSGRDRGKLAGEHLWAFGPLAGGTPALPGGRSRGERLRMGAFLGARASCPLEHTDGPSAHKRTRPWEARRGTPVGFRPTCGRDARAPRRVLPGESGYAWAHSWERGHLARLNTRMDLQHTSGRDRGKLAGEHLWAFGPLAGGTPALPGGCSPGRAVTHGRIPGSAGILSAEYCTQRTDLTTFFSDCPVRILDSLLAVLAVTDRFRLKLSWAG